MGTEISALPNFRQVYYSAYADFPIGCPVSDLAFATDRLVLYRWSGAAWQAITIHTSSGLAAAIPAAADLPDGSLYVETDTGFTKQVQAGAWVVINSPGATLTIAETEVFSATAPTTWTDLDLSGTIGAKSSLVLLKFNRTGSNLDNVAVRRNGDTDEFDSATANANAYGCALGKHADGVYLVLWVATDAAGIIEWIAGTGAACTVDIIAYIN